jgi:hypothetical protein
MHSFKLFDEFTVISSTPLQLQGYLSSKKVTYTVKSIKKSMHIRSTESGFEVEYQEGREQQWEISSVFVYISSQHIREYPPGYSLPYHLHSRTTIKAAAMILGEPTSMSKFAI